jgi:hypothetical protein
MPIPQDFIPNSITAYLQVNGRKHVWSYWGQLNKKIKQARYEDMTSTLFSNWESLLKYGCANNCTNESS